MEPTNQNININNNAVVATQGDLPGWFRLVLNLYGLKQVLAGIGAFAFPLLTGTLVSAMGGGKEGFATGYKMYAFLAVGALPAFILAYGSLKKRKWIIACLGISLLFVVFNSLFLASEAISASSGSVSPSSIGLLNIIPILILVLALVYRKSLKGEYFAIVPIALMLIASAYSGFLVKDTLKTAQEEAGNNQVSGQSQSGQFSNQRE